MDHMDQQWPLHDLCSVIPSTKAWWSQSLHESRDLRSAMKPRRWLKLTTCVQVIPTSLLFLGTANGEPALCCLGWVVLSREHLGGLTSLYTARFWTLLTSTALKDIRWDPSSRCGKLGWACRDDFLSDRFALISWRYRIVILFKSACINGSFMIILKSFAVLSPLKNKCARAVFSKYFNNELNVFLPNRKPKVYSNIQSMFLHL